MNTLKASQTGLQLIEQARHQKDWNKSSKAWLSAAYTSRSTMNRFWAKKAIRKDAFISICEAVGVAWEQVADPSDGIFQPTSARTSGQAVEQTSSHLSAQQVAPQPAQPGASITAQSSAIQPTPADCFSPDGKLNFLLVESWEKALHTALKQTFQQLSFLEASAMYWLALSQAPVSLAHFQLSFPDAIESNALIGAIESLCHRSLLQKQQGKLVLQPRVMAFALDSFVQRACEEIISGRYHLLKRYRLINRQAQDSVQAAQVRYVLQALIHSLVKQLGSYPALESHLGGQLRDREKNNRAHKRARQQGKSSSHHQPHHRGHLRSNLSALLQQLQLEGQPPLTRPHTKHPVAKQTAAGSSYNYASAV